MSFDSVLSAIDIPPSVSFIGAGALAGTALESITLTGQATVGDTRLPNAHL
jgi:hypothetical protein